MIRQNFKTVLVGLIGGFLLALIGRKICNGLPFGPAEGGTWSNWAVGMIASSVLGALAVFIPVILAAQSPTKFPKPVVIKIVSFVAAIVGMIGAGVVFLLMLTNSAFYQGVGIMHVLITVVVCAVANVGLFRVGLTMRGFDHEREEEAEGPERFQVKIKAETLEKLRGNRKGD